MKIILSSCGVCLNLLQLERNGFSIFVIGTTPIEKNTNVKRMLGELSIQVLWVNLLSIGVRPIRDMYEHGRANVGRACEALTMRVTDLTGNSVIVQSLSSRI